MKAVNWNTKDDLTLAYWQQNIAQFWTDTEFKVSKDLRSWEEMSDSEREVYKHVLAGLTGLDTQQGDLGMPVICIHTEDLRKKAVYSFMNFMEQMHAKSYSSIFTTLISINETEYLLGEFVENNPFLQRKGELIGNFYEKLLAKNVSTVDLYLAKVASVFLESFIFYSGFFYPLYLSGHGKMTTSGEIIRKILLDESIHGSFTGLDAQEDYKKLTEQEQKYCDDIMWKLFHDLYNNEVEYTKSIYDAIGLSNEVIEYVKYNANKSLSNLGKDSYFNNVKINAIVQNGLDTSSKNHDFFSVKGDSYVVGSIVEDTLDEDFDFDFDFE